MQWYLCVSLRARVCVMLELAVAFDDTTNALAYIFDTFFFFLYFIELSPSLISSFHVIFFTTIRSVD